jgi:small subunit ribosomal protein S4
VIKVCEKSKESPLIQGIAQELAHKTIPVWLSVVVNDMSGTLVRYPSREEMDVSIQEHLIVELYSR